MKKHLLQELYDAYKGDYDGDTATGSDFNDLMGGIAEILEKPDSEIVVQIHNGLIEDVRGVPSGVKIIVEDFDVDGADPDEIDGTGKGPDETEIQPCYRSVYTADGVELHVPDKTEIAPEAEEADRFVNYYRHDKCPKVGTAVIWQDKSPYTNNDRCPECNTEIEPYKSEDIPE